MAETSKRYRPAQSRYNDQHLHAGQRPLLVEFVKQMTAMTNGKAYFANPGNLSQFVLIDFPEEPDASDK